MNRIHFGHMCYAGATLVFMTTIASMLGHVQADNIIRIIAVVAGMLALTAVYSTFRA